MIRYPDLATVARAKNRHAVSEGCFSRLQSQGVMSMRRYIALAALLAIVLLALVQFGPSLLYGR